MIRLDDLLRRRPPRNGVYPTICIDGRGASGKTTLADLLGAARPELAVIHGDDYFAPNDDPVTWGDFDEERFDADVVSRVRTGERSIPLRPFDFPAGVLGPQRPVAVTGGLVVERWLALGLDAPWDVTVWVETPAEVCLRRGLERDGAQVLGDRARLAWESVWQPREDRYIERLRPLRTADVVLDGTRTFADQLDLD